MSERPALEPRPDPIAVGDTAPDFTLPAIATDGTTSDLTFSEVLTRGPVLLIFYQDDGMPLCTSELKAFAQEHELIAGAGVQVIGMNTNGIGSHQKFQERDRFPFPLVSDFYGDAVKAYGLWQEEERKSQRALVLVGQDRRVRHVETHFNPRNLPAYQAAFAAMGLA